MKRITAALLLSITSIAAWSGAYEWTSGWGMGITEYQVDDGNNNALLISCPNYDGAVSASATINGKQYWSNDQPGFDVIIDGQIYRNPFFTDCRVCGDTFRNAFWSALRSAKHLSLHAEHNTVHLPTRGLIDNIPALNDPENSCRSAW